MVHIMDIILANMAYQQNKFSIKAAEQYIQFETSAFTPLMRSN
jgi:hypothetical protein